MAAPAGPPPAESRDVRLFPPEGSAEGCASGDCLPDAGEAEAAPAPPPEPRQDPLLPSAAVPAADRWRDAVDRVKKASSRHGASLAFGRLLWIRPGEVAVAFPKEAAFHRSTVVAQSGRALVEKVLAEHFGAPTRLVIEEAAELAAAAAPSLAEEEARSRAAHEKSTDQMVRSHPAVRAALRVLGGEVEHIQVLERPRPGAAELDAGEEPPDRGRPD